MTGPSPTVGRPVHYRLTDQDVNDIFLMVGNRAIICAGDVRPAMVITVDTRVAESVDLQVFIGPCTLWRTSVVGGTPSDDRTHGRWFWPPRV